MDVLELCKKVYDNLNVSGMVSTQVSLSIICITFFGYIVSNLSYRFVGVSTKMLFFRHELYPLSGINIICVCLALDVINIFLGNIDYVNNKSCGYVICKMIFIIFFIIELILIGIFLYRVYAFVSKKSIIYQKIWEKIDNKPKLYNVFRDKVAAISVRNWKQKNPKYHNSYYVEEIITLYLLYYNKSSGEPEKVIFYNAANNIQDQELYLSVGYKQLNLLERNWQKYYSKADEIVRTPNNSSGNKGRDNKMNDKIKLPQKKIEKYFETSEIKKLAKSYKKDYSKQKNDINEIAYVRKRLVDDLNEKSNSDAGLKKTYV